MWGVSYWFIPLFSGSVWLAMLLTMLLHWVTQGKPHYYWQDPNQRVAYISDVGATSFGKPVFIAMGATAVVSFDLGFIAERWLRHRGRLTHNTSMFQKVLSILTIICAIIGAAGLILLTCFDDRLHPNLHDAFLVVFIVGYVLSAIFICWEYQRLGIHFREHRILRISFWIKLMFILVEVALAIAFGVLRHEEHRNSAAVVEWVVALIFAIYVYSFFIDFIPAVHSKHHQSRETAEMAATNNAESGLPMTEDAGMNRYGHAVNTHAKPQTRLADGHGAYGNGHVNGNGYTNGNGHVNGNGYANGNGYTNGNGTYANGHTNGHVKPAIPASQNF